MSASHHLWIDSLGLTVAMHCLSRLPFGVDSPYPDVLVEKSVIHVQQVPFGHAVIEL